ncbi:hypothetical protein Focb16_v016310 [Fusarium oxysporum f. sp. cubense]|uniref:F-box domain-containing protein n=1 Tax=Fusarium oxysporum f. sp. cubense TaxID=61366 RepID=A0A559KWN9_FUSOC|nr:hypothetical protein Focb16_v016310 [Fusarium oxysporum f. sp. cubense]
MPRLFKFFGKSTMTRRHLDDCDWSIPLSIPKRRRAQTPGKLSLLLACPVEIQLSVLAFLFKEDLVALSLVNRHLANIAQPILHKEVDVSCPSRGTKGEPNPLVLVVRTLLARPDLAQAVQHLRFDGYDFPARKVDVIPTTRLTRLTRNDKGKAVELIRSSGLEDAIGWAKCFLGGQVDSIVALLVALTPRVRTIYLGEDFSVEVHYLRLLFESQHLTALNTSSLHKFEYLRDVTVNNHAATYYHRRFDFTNVFQSFFHLHMLDRLYISGSFPEDSRPVVAGKKLEHLSRLDLKRIGEAELEQILSLAPNLTNLAYTYAWHSKTGDSSTQPLTLDLSTLRNSLEGHRLKLRWLELLAIDNTDVVKQNTLCPLGLQGSPLKLHDFLIFASFSFRGSSSMARRMGRTPHRYNTQPYWGWNIKDIKRMVTDYLQYVKETKTALTALYMVGPLLGEAWTAKESFSTRTLARSAGVRFRAVTMTVAENRESGEVKERYRRYGKGPRGA